MEFYNLKILGNQIFLDDEEVKGVNSYTLEQTENNVPMLTLKIYVEPTISVKK